MSRYELFAGFRNSGTGQLSGPFINEEKLSAILKLIPAPESPKQYLFPDLFPLINFVNAQIEEGLKIQEERLTRIMLQQQEKQHLEALSGRYEDLFTQWKDDFGMTAEDRKESAERDKRLDADYRASLPLLQDRLYSSLTTREQTLARHYSDRVSFTPDGQGDFVVQVTEAAQ